MTGKLQKRIIRKKTDKELRCHFCIKKQQSPASLKPVMKRTAFCAFGGGSIPFEDFQNEPDWLACRSCMSLIEGQKWSRLVKRNVFGTLATYPQIAPSQEMIQQLALSACIVFSELVGENLEECKWLPTDVSTL